MISKKGREFSSKVVEIIKQSGEVHKPIDGDIHIFCALSPKDQRKRDLDNVDGKALWDALTKAGVWLDDSQVKTRFSEMLPYEKSRAGLVYVAVRQLRKRGLVQWP